MLNEESIMDEMKKFGYTHRINFQRYSSFLGMWCDAYFSTEKTALPLHLKSMKNAKHIRNVVVTEL
jgi:hypothetical protein